MSVNSSDQRQTDLRGSTEEQPVVPAELESVNKRLGRLKDEVLPSSPYLLTVPTDVPFRLGNRFVNNWAVGKKGPFAIEEQQLQYMTFLMHHDADSLLVAAGDWSDNDGRIMGKKDDEKPQATPSASATPQTGTTKRKITLSDYKTRATKGEPSKEHPGPSQEPPPDDTRKEKNESLQVPLSRTIKERPSHDRMLDNNNNNSLSTSPRSRRPLKEPSKHASDAPAVKRARLTPSGSTEVSMPSKSSSNGIPALLSPTLPPTSSSPRLPELLSPTLPPELEKELAQIASETSLSSNKDFKRDATTVYKASRNEGLNTKSLIHEKVRSDSKPATSKVIMKEDSRSSSLAASGKNNVKSREQEWRSTSPYEERSSMKQIGTTSTTAGSATAKKLIVKLKYGRGNRKRVGALLKFGGKSKLSESSAPPRALKESFSGDEDIDSSRSDIKFRGRKRERSPDDDREEEHHRRRALGAKTIPSDAAKISNTNSFKSPSNKRLPVSRPDIPTPAKDSYAKSQRHADSTDAEVKTPLGTSGKGLATTADKTIKTSPSNSDGQPGSREKERRAWREEFQKHTGLGRELKHIADRYSRAKATSEHVSTTDGKLAAVSAIESILCFIVAFIANDRFKTLARQVGDSETWRSIIAYWRVVERTTAAYPHLHGLCLILGAVSHDAINSLDLERLAVCSVPGEQSPVPTPGSDGNTVNADKNKSQKREFFDLKSRLPENHKEANRLWLEGCRGLPDDVLSKEYPETWAKRSRNFAERGHDSFKVGQYAGAFFLPFGRTTTPMEAVRFGVTLLREWCKKENIDFKARLKL
ncbi:hypothetical protein UA08_07696 [Talaromyces atroroseus]|uniref:Ell binding protein Ebp1 C-terminal domain-containing protein n=1 Tax=Talaromyces atroroseus TaxID=1441469 RepID=A0A225AV70_TALAT|nr:hypothetical protein UA08_07696 [Talaromyces atroroseus]OKL57377.1 hypothetical protein UA08_07696 [Talaromyces atroroseus]